MSRRILLRFSCVRWRIFCLAIGSSSMQRRTQPRLRPNRLPSFARLDSRGRLALRGAWRSRRVLGGAFWTWAFGGGLYGVTARSKPGYNVCSCYALEGLHPASSDVLDRGTRLSPPVPFRAAFACARQSLRQRLVFFPLLASLIAISLFAFSP